jgi:hypothetical protein
MLAMHMLLRCSCTLPSLICRCCIRGTAVR